MHRFINKGLNAGSNNQWQQMASLLGFVLIVDSSIKPSTILAHSEGE